jgi:UDPglucose--hexose-1-phosphate uridylyltransferase
MIEPALGDLLRYAVSRGLITDDDLPYARNRVLDVLAIRDYDPAREQDPSGGERDIDSLLAPLLDDAAARGLITPDTVNQRDLWDTAIMGCFVAPPAAVAERFWAHYAREPVLATDYYHRAAVASNYIRVGRTDQNITWRQPTRYGEMDMTINVSKPEKDPRDIAAAAGSAGGGYPICLLCRENEGYPGRSDHPARQNLRLIGMELVGEQWFLQYSPYRYYNEHCIVLSEQHRPMRIDDTTFARLAAFTEVLAHYLVGSNADLPIVGGSILSHDHFQGGRYEFAMDRARAAWSTDRDGVDVEVLNWPLAVLRVRGADADVLAFCSRVLAAWRAYSASDYGVLSHTHGVPHNTITPIARRTDGVLRVDLVLRNNRTSDQHPDGVFHPHAEIHPVKRENIGLIEVMGLAVLPGRLAVELDAVARALLDGTDLPDEVGAHRPMLDELRAAGPATDLAQAQTRARGMAGEYFVRGLEHCGVFGADAVAGCQAFLDSLD